MSQNNLLQMLGSQFDASTVRRIGSVIGADPQATATAISGALPLLLGALQRNAAAPSGAGALFGALAKDHDGSLLDNLGGFLGQLTGAGAGQRPAPGASASRTSGFGLGEAILGHVLGGKTDRAATQIGKASGLDAQAVMKLLAVLAPIVMAALGKAQRQQHIEKPADLGDLLGRSAPAGSSSGGGGLGDLVGSVLDRDGDGSALNDLVRMGSGVLGSLLGGGKR